MSGDLTWVVLRLPVDRAETLIAGLEAYSYDPTTVTFNKINEYGTVNLGASAGAGDSITIAETLPAGIVYLFGAVGMEITTVGSGTMTVIQAASGFGFWPHIGQAPGSISNTPTSGFSFSGIGAGSLPSSKTLTVATPERAQVVPMVTVRQT